MREVTCPASIGVERGAPSTFTLRKLRLIVGRPCELGVAYRKRRRIRKAAALTLSSAKTEGSGTEKASP